MPVTSISYGLWPLVILNSAMFIFFAFSFTRPRIPRDWRSLGAFSAFVVALFAEMYGFPLTIYLTSGWIQAQAGDIDIFAHNSGHLWSTIFQLDGNPHANILHFVSNILIAIGFIVLAASWRELHAAQRDRYIATSGPYAVVRHPQYVAFVIVMVGFLFQWPTLLTAAMFPVLVFMYVRLAKREEKVSFAEFGTEYAQYASQVPRFVPRINLHLAGSPNG